MTEIIFASNNAKKVDEVRAILGKNYTIKTLKDINFTEEIPEPYDTIRENSIYKAKFFVEKTGLPCIAEDSGLEVDVLDGRPSAYSARYAGEERNDIKNYEKLLSELEDKENRKARFVSIITFLDGDKLEVFEGNMEGNIAEKPKGGNGFGYDPIFVPTGYTQTNAELTAEEKNTISHRKKALDKLTEYFNR